MKRTPSNDRREFLRLAGRAAGAVAVAAAFPPSIRRAIAVPAAQNTGTIRDVEHIVLLMQENRSFDHYFGTLRGVRGFADRHPVPLASGKSIWHQSDGMREIAPYHLDTKTTSALRVPVTPHSFADAQAAWSQGRYGYWPKYKTEFSMGYFRREDIPFQYALADAFTICDAYHCSVTTGTDPNRIVFWSGSNFNPELRLRGENCTDVDSEPDNLRCWVEGTLPKPGYTYAGSAFKWPTVPDVLEKAGVSWRIYQDPNDNWTGAMHGGLAFESFRMARPDSALFRNGMSHWSLEKLQEHVRSGKLPAVSWILPPARWSEHPKPSSPLQGAEFTARVLDILTSNPDVWSRTVFLLTFDENDGQFDHVPPPAPPSYNKDGTPAGKSTLDLKGEYFSDPERKHLHPEDRDAGTVRPWGLGPRVPMYVISPWSKGGWVNSQVFDHTSVGQFLEKRFGVHIPGISPWHRVVSGDLTSAFDFEHPEKYSLSHLPDVSHSESIVMQHSKRPLPRAPRLPEGLFQEPGIRPSRALPYVLEVESDFTPARSDAPGNLALKFINKGSQGAVFHVYDRLRLDRFPRRYTVEAQTALEDDWLLPPSGAYDLWVLGTNGFVRNISGTNSSAPRVTMSYRPQERAVQLDIHNQTDQAIRLEIRANAYRTDGPWSITLAPGEHASRSWFLADSGNWYDLTVNSSHFVRRFAGRMETSSHSISDPAQATDL